MGGIMKLLFFQIGNYRQGFQAMMGETPETYRNQRETVRFVADLAKQFHVTTLSVGDDAHEEELADNLHSVRVPQTDAATAAAIGKLAPDLIVCRTPNLPVLHYAKAKGIKTLPMLADTFLPRSGLRGLRDRLYLRKLNRVLHHQPHIPCICNHNLNAAQSLIDGIGLDPAQVVPWDWPPLPAHPEPKSSANAPLSLTYTGMIYEAKGVGDALEALALLNSQGMSARLNLFGEAQGTATLADWQKRADRMGLGDQVTFHGSVANDVARQSMRDSDIVLVPSRHDYPEGMPKTLIEGLASRSPVVISDHPVFANRLVHEQECLQFRASQPEAMAQAIRRLAEEPGLYSRLSGNADHTIKKLSTGTLWFDVITSFLDDPDNSKSWVSDINIGTWRSDQA